MSKQKKSKLSSIFGSMLFLIFLATVIAAIVFLVRDLKDNGVSGVGGIFGNVTGEDVLTVKYNSNTLSDGENIDLPESGQARFNVSVDGGYTVQVLPNVTHETDFNFYVDGVAHSFISEKFTDYFISNYNLHDDYFIISSSYEVYTVGAVLRWYYSSDNISVNEVQAEYPFNLIVTSTKSGKSVSFGMKQVNREKSIKFDFDGDIVF